MELSAGREEGEEAERGRSGANNTIRPLCGSAGAEAVTGTQAAVLWVNHRCIYQRGLGTMRAAASLSTAR